MISGIYSYFFFLKPIKNKTYKKFYFSVELPVLIFILYSVLLFLPLFYGEIKFKNILTEFNNLWIKLGFLKYNDIVQKKYIDFNYWTALLSLMTVISNYLLFKLILNTRRNIKLLYRIFFATYNLILIYSFINIIYDKTLNSYFLVNPNHLATFVSVPMPVIFYLYFIKKESKTKDIFLSAIKLLHTMFLFFLLYLTGGRVAIASTFFLMLIYMLIENKKIGKKHILFTLTFIFTVFIMVFINKGIVDSGIIVTEQITGSVSLKLRQEIISNSFSIFNDNFLFGVGPGQFSVIYPYYSRGYELTFIHHAHNDYIQFLVEYGMAGVIIIVFLYYRLILFIKEALKKLKGNSYHLLLATVFSILIFHFEIFTGFQSHIGILFQMLIFLVASLYIIVYNFDKHYKSNSDELL